VKKVLAAGKPVTAFNGAWELAQLGLHQLGQQRYDLIICAHVLYFVAQDSWDGFLQSMISYLKPGGRMVVVLVAKGDETSEAIGRWLGIKEPGSYPFSAAAIECLTARDHGFEIVPFEASISAKTAEALLEVMALFPIMQYDISSPEEQRLALIQEQFKHGDEYRMRYVVDVIVVEAQE
jgi:SAM-dependent methyltransferase